MSKRKGIAKEDSVLDEMQQEPDSLYDDIEDSEDEIEYDGLFGSAEEEALEADICAQEIEKIEKEDEGYKTYTPDEWAIIIKDLYGEDEERRKAASNMVYEALWRFNAHITQSYYPTYTKEWDDMKQEGFKGIMIALKNYNPRKGKPTTWCFHEIIHANREYIDHMIHGTTPHFQSRITKIQEIIEKRERAGEDWSAEEIGDMLGVSPVTVRNCISIMRSNKNILSIDQEIGDGDVKIGDNLISNTPGPEEIVMKEAFQEEIRKTLIKYLTPDERLALCYAHGLIDGDRKTSREISRLTGIRQQDVRRIVNTAEEKYRRGLTRDGKFREERMERSKFIKKETKTSFIPPTTSFEGDYAALGDEFFEDATLWNISDQEDGF